MQKTLNLIQNQWTRTRFSFFLYSEVPAKATKRFHFRRFCPSFGPAALPWSWQAGKSQTDLRVRVAVVPHSLRLNRPSFFNCLWGLPLFDIGCNLSLVLNFFWCCRHDVNNDRWFVGRTNQTAVSAAKSAFEVIKGFKRGLAASDDHYQVQTLAPIRQYLAEQSATNPKVSSSTLGDLCGMFWPEHQAPLEPGAEDTCIEHFFTVDSGRGLKAVVYPVLHRDCAASRTLFSRLSPALKF
jgi:hypothetical protein